MRCVRQHVFRLDFVRLAPPTVQRRCREGGSTQINRGTWNYVSYPISMLPEHLHSTSLSYAETTWKHTIHKETLFLPSYRSLPVSQSPTPPHTPLHRETRPHPHLPIILVYSAQQAGRASGRSHLFTFASPLRLRNYRCFLMNWLYWHSVFHIYGLYHIYLYIRSAFYVFSVRKGGGGQWTSVLCSPSS